MANITPSAGLKIQSGAFGSSNTVRLEITNWAEVMKTLRDMDTRYVTGLRKNFKRIAKGPQESVQRAIPGKSKPPLSNMRQVWFGRLAWGTTWGGGGPDPKPAKSVLIQLPNTRKKKYRDLERIPVVRLQIGSPGTVLFDMAYRRGGAKGRKGMTPEYDYIYRVGGLTYPGKRKHRVVPGAFLKGILKSGQVPKASRIVWPAALKAMPKFTNDAKDVIYNINRLIQFELLRKQ